MKVIFLDIDGVLNRMGTRERYRSFIGIDRELAEKFNILVERTGAFVVLSSTWRLEEHWRQILKDFGLDTTHLIGCTPRLPGEIRGKEIEAWLKGHPDVERYAILDDDGDMLSHQNLFQTLCDTGLTDAIIEAVVAYLGTKGISV